MLQITREIAHVEGGQSPATEIPTSHFRLGHRRDGHPVRFDIRSGALFPDHSFPDRTGTVRTGRRSSSTRPTTTVLARKLSGSPRRSVSHHSRSISKGLAAVIVAALLRG
jgi:hypothetical protein